MNRLTSLAALTSLGLVTSCAASTQAPSPEPAPTQTGTPTPTPTSPSTSGQQAAAPAAPSSSGDEAVASDVDANLKALRDLQIFDVQGVVSHIPEQANCYNIACPGHEQEFADAKARDAKALAELTRKAVDAANSAEIELTPEYTERCYTSDDENLAALKALDVVRVGSVVEAPETYQAGNCYSVKRARKLARVAVALTKP